MKRVNFARILLGITSALFVSAAYAATPTATTLPGSVLPGRIGQDQKLPEAPKAVPSVTGTKQIQSLPLPHAKEIKFVLKRINLVGSTVYKQGELAEYYSPFVGKKISLFQLQKIVDQITLRYRKDGYILSKAILPPQTIAGGGVKIQVIEGYVDQVKVVGKGNRVKELLVKYGHHITAERPLKISTLERYALLSNDLPGVIVRSVLEPSKVRQGAAHLTMIVKYTPLNAFARIDNRGTRFLGPYQMSFGASGNSVFTGGDMIGGRTLFTTDTTQLNFYEAYGQMQVNSYGTYLDINGNRSTSNPGFTLEPFNVQGKAEIGTIFLIHPFIRSRRQNLMGRIGFQALNSKNSILVPTNLLFSDKIRSAIIGASYDWVDKMNGINLVSAQFWKGIDGLGASNPASGTPLSRPNGKPDYSKVVMYASHTQPIRRKLSAVVELEGQYAGTDLLSSSQYAYGGPNFGRAYDPAEIIGDSGIAAKVELRLDDPDTPSFLKRPERTFNQLGKGLNRILGQKLFQHVQYFLYYDIGKIWNRDRVNLVRTQSGASAGIGARIQILRNVFAEVSADQPLTRDVAAQVLAGRDGKATRVFFNIQANLDR